MSCRNEIASCEETAYNSLPIKDAATLLFFRTQQEVLTYAQQVRKFVYTGIAATGTDSTL